jgi:threonine/homoserine/homoserine lactone efflux protein
MLKYIVIGGGLAFAAAVQPGPMQAYLLARVAAIGWRRTLPAALSPLLSDPPIAFLALVILGRVSPAARSVLRGAGGILLFYLAARTFLAWRRGAVGARPGRDRAPRTLVEAAMVNLLNPNPYLGWTLVLGPATVSAWRQAPVLGVAVVASFYATLVGMLAVSIAAFGTARFLGPRLQRSLLAASAAVLAGLGLYQLLVCVRFFTGG